MELPFFSFFVSLFSVFTGNGTTNFNLPNNSHKSTSPVRQIILNITGKMKVTPTISTTTTTTTTQLPDLLMILCPMSQNQSSQLHFRYYNRTKRCYPVSSKGPCGTNMAYFAEDETYGECGCQTTDDRLLIYNKKQNQCYFIFQQGFCGKTQWLDITRNGIPICIRNPCTSHIRGSKKDFVYFQSRCVEVGESWSGCDQDQVVGFKMFRRLPTCISSHSIPASARAIGVPTTPCDLGSVMALDGRCNPPFEFD